MKIKLFTALLAVLVLTGCGAKKGNAYDMLKNMDSYTARAEVRYISNKGENVYDTVQTAKKDGRYRIDTLSPEEYKDTSLIYDGKLVWQKAGGKENKIKVTSNSPERALLILYSFLENHEKSMSDATVTTSASPNGNTTVLEADIAGGDKVFASEKLWFDENKGVPTRLAIYNAEGKEKIVVNFSEFKYNESIDNGVFSIQ